MSRKAQSQSRSQHQATANQNGLPSLSAANASDSASSHGQINDLSKRTTQMLRAVAELRAELEQAPGLADWPDLISRHSTLLSQLYSLTSSLTSTNANYLSSQLSSLTEFLDKESRSSNMFTQGEVDADDPTSNYSRLPSIKYSDPANNLLNLEAHPMTNAYQDEEKRNVLGQVLRTKLNPDLEEADEKLIKAYQIRSESLNGDRLSRTNDPEKEKLKLSLIRQDKANHDDLMDKATRIFFHKMNEPDEDGITYDFRMRLPKDSDGTEILADSNQEGEQDDEGEEGMEEVQMEE